MRIVYIQTYPAYHDFGDSERWLSLQNRDKWMPGITASFGHECELWCVTNKHKSFDFFWEDGFSYPIRQFRPDSIIGKTKKHTSREMVSYANQNPADLYVLKGTDGGIGLKMLKHHIIPKNIPFAFVIGGKWSSPYAHKASSILYETQRQKDLLIKSDWKFWEKPCDESRLIHLPKSTDTDLFKPDSNISKEFDVVSMGRLIPYYKNYDALMEISHSLKVAFIGGGPNLEIYRNKHPEIEWLGPVPNQKVPEYLNKAKSFFYTGLRDHFPRVLVESASCGLPVIAFDEVIGADVIPDSIGLRVSRLNFKNNIIRYCQNDALIKETSINAREYACSNWNKHSSEDAIRKMIELATK
jgi:glycosyltransferase involved in cell wall biosynthesis